MSDQQVFLKMNSANDIYTALSVDDGTTEDAENRFQIQADGTLSFGNGTDVPDVVLERTAAGVLSLTTGSLVIPSGSIAAPRPVVNCTASTLAVTAALHSNAVIKLNRAAGIAVTLPAATGSGAVYTFIVGTTFTANGTIAVANASDYMRGRVYTLSDGAAAVLGYSTSNSGTPATESDTITLYTAASNTTGGIIGDIITLIDATTNVWHVLGHTQSGGTEATPFSAEV